MSKRALVVEDDINIHHARSITLTRQKFLLALRLAVTSQLALYGLCLHQHLVGRKHCAHQNSLVGKLLLAGEAPRFGVAYLRGPLNRPYLLGYALGSTLQYLLLAPKVAARQQQNAMSLSALHLRS